MAVKTETGWKCNICNVEYSHFMDAYTCEQTHDVVYVPFRREDLFKLIQFLYTGDTKLLSTTLIDTLMKYKSQMKGQ